MSTMLMRDYNADFPADLVAAVRDAKTKLDEIAAIKTEAIKI